jgi:hypothetical protein
MLIVRTLVGGVIFLIDPELSLSSESGGVGNALSPPIGRNWERRNTFSIGAGEPGTGATGALTIVSGVEGGVNSGVNIPVSLTVPWTLDSPVPEEDSYLARL